MADLKEREHSVTHAQSANKNKTGSSCGSRGTECFDLAFQFFDLENQRATISDLDSETSDTKIEYISYGSSVLLLFLRNTLFESTEQKREFSLLSLSSLSPFYQQWGYHKDKNKGTFWKAPF